MLPWLVVLQRSAMKHFGRRKQKSEVLRARCSPDLKKRVTELAQRRGHDEADLVRQAVIELMERIEAGIYSDSSLKALKVRTDRQRVAEEVAP